MVVSRKTSRHPVTPGIITPYVPVPPPPNPDIGVFLTGADGVGLYGADGFLLMGDYRSDTTYKTADSTIMTADYSR